MNDINELLRIIKLLGGSATAYEIVEEYCKKYHMIIQPHFVRVVESTLFNNLGSFRQNKATSSWEIKTSETEDYIYVSDNRYFNTIRDAMLQVFNQSVPARQGYFKVDEEHVAWFPQPNDVKWGNILSEDGRFWYEKPKTMFSEYEPDYKLRYVFSHEDDGYRFTGLFKVNDMLEDRTRVFELVDDKVKIIKPQPYLIVCRVAYMKYYDGVTDDDVPVNGGSYVSENNDAGEKLNFHRYDDGNCYVFVETKYKKGHTGENDYAKKIALEQIDPLYKGKDSICGVKVVLTAFSPKLQKNVVVGWYDNATIYRNRIVESDKTYMMKCAFSDAHLIPEDKRLFEIPRAQGNDYGIGQNNFWYIQRSENARQFEKNLIEYIDSIS